MKRGCASSRPLHGPAGGGPGLPWSVADAPEDYIRAQLKGIVGVEIPISRIEGKWKASQNRADDDRAGVAEGLRNEGCGAMARLVIERGGAREASIR